MRNALARYMLLMSPTPAPGRLGTHSNLVQVKPLLVNSVERGFSVPDWGTFGLSSVLECRSDKVCATCT